MSWFLIVPVTSAATSLASRAGVSVVVTASAVVVASALVVEICSAVVASSAVIISWLWSAAKSTPVDNKVINNFPNLFWFFIPIYLRVKLHHFNMILLYLSI